MESSGSSVRVEGLRELIKTLKAAGDEEAKRALKETHSSLAKDVERTAEPLVPRLTGTLVDTLRSSGTVRGAYVRVGKASVPYAPAIHFGWFRRNIAPQPFLFSALDSRRTEVEHKYQEALDRITSTVKGVS